MSLAAQILVILVKNKKIKCIFSCFTVCSLLISEFLIELKIFKTGFCLSKKCLTVHCKIV